MDCNYLVKAREEPADMDNGCRRCTATRQQRGIFYGDSNGCDKGLSGRQPPALCEKPFRSPCHRPIEQSEITLPNDPWGLRSYQTPNW